MAAFDFDLKDGTKCVSKNGTTCTYKDGQFIFPSNSISIGHSAKTKSGGIGGFIGADPEYFVYYGDKDAEIAFANFDSRKKTWKSDKVCQLKVEIYDERTIEEIWTSKDKSVLFFVPYEEFLEEVVEQFGDKYIEVDLRVPTARGVAQDKFFSKRDMRADSHSGSTGQTQIQTRPEFAASHKGRGEPQENSQTVEERYRNLAKSMKLAKSHLVQDKLVFVAGHFTPLNQDYVKQILTKHGAQITTSLTRSVDLVITGTQLSPRMMQKARAINLVCKQWKSLGVIEESDQSASKR